MATEVEPGGRREGRAGEMFRSLSHANFRLFWVGAFVSNVGIWMQAVAQGWLVLQLTDSAFWLGVEGFTATAPGMVLTLLGGVFADLGDRKKILIYSRVGAGLSALVLALLIVAGAVRDSGDVWIILLLSFITGCCMAISGPSFQAITVDLVGREDLANAIALNSAQFQLSRVIGPVFAGIAFKVFGVAGCFFANGLAFVAVVASLLKVRYNESRDAAAHPLHPISDKRALWQDLLDGFRYVRKRPRVSALLLISAVTSLFGAPYLPMIPLFARNIMDLDETGLALMMGTAGAGAFCGALTIAYLGDFRHKGWSVLGGSWLFGASLMGFALSSRLDVSLVFLLMMGFSIVCSVAVINTLLQKLVTDDMRGRVMSMFILSFVGAMPIGSLVAGAASERWGAPRTLASGGLIIVVFITVVTIRNKRLRELN